MTPKKGLAKYLLKQPINRRVLAALSPCVLAAIYFYGWRSLAMVLWAAAVGFMAEYAFTSRRKEPVSEAVFVTSTIFALIMPPTVPWHMMAIGMIFAIVFTKEVFGGYGRNVFNPAMAGFCFIYICFPVALTSTWVIPAAGPMGALKRWSAASVPDAVTSATPMSNLKAGKLILGGPQDLASGEIPREIPEGGNAHVEKRVFLKGLLFGKISGTMGVTSVIAVCIGGIYLFITKTANRSIIVSLIATYALLSQTLFWLGVKPVPEAWAAVLGGGFLFGAFFMATDPVSAPKTDEGRIVYGIVIGVLTVVIYNFSIFNGGLMFSILIGNMFVPTIDQAVRGIKEARKA